MGLIRTLCSMFLSVAAFTTSTVFAQQWPSHSISIISPVGPGTTNDIVAQIVLDPVGSQFGQRFVFENRPGGATTIGVASVVKASPDGYTLLVSSSAVTAAVILHKSLSYNVLRDLEPVAMFGGEPSILIGAPNKGYANLADLVTAAESNANGIKFGFVGIGSASYLAGERFRLPAGLKAKHVAYPGAAEALADLSAGRIDFYVVPVLPALPLITQGKAIPLAVSTPTRLQSLPGLPMLAESGYPIPPSDLVWSFSTRAYTARYRKQTEWRYHQNARVAGGANKAIANRLPTSADES